MGIHEKLMKIQSELKAPKGQYNSFGKYHYRSCEDILEGVKPLLVANKATLRITDEVVMIGDRYYIKATAIIGDTESGEGISVSAFAREDETKKGMDLAQVTGSVSSYARKYALNGLFCIDDTKDSDSTNTHDKGTTKATGGLTEPQIKRLFAIANKAGYDNQKLVAMVLTKYKKPIEKLSKEEYDHICNGLEVKKW